MSRLAGLDMLRQESPRKETRHPSAVAAIGGYPEGINCWGSGLMRRRTFRAGCLGVVRSSVGGGGGHRLGHVDLPYVCKSSIAVCIFCP